MIDAAVEICGVKLLGNRGLIYELGPLLIASAAALAAWLAARYARLRQEAQLEHDSARQEKQLEHDSARQEKQLEHDRVLKKSDRARETIDSAISVAIVTWRATTAYRTAIQVREPARQDALAVLASGQASPQEKASAETKLTRIRDILHDRLDNSHSATMELRFEFWRIRVRLGSEHQIVACYRELADASDLIHETSRLGQTKDRTDDEKQAGEDAAQKRTKAFQAFISACEAWFIEDL